MIICYICTTATFDPQTDTVVGIASRDMSFRLPSSQLNNVLLLKNPKTKASLSIQDTRTFETDVNLDSPARIFALSTDERVVQPESLAIPQVLSIATFGTAPKADTVKIVGGEYRVSR